MRRVRSSWPAWSWPAWSWKGSSEPPGRRVPPGDSEVVTVGAILSESGIYSTLGPPEHNAMTMGLEALNKNGFDVGGTHYTMDVTFADDKSDAATTGVAAFREMAESTRCP